MTRDAGVLRERGEPRAGGTTRSATLQRLRPRGAEPPHREPRARARGVGAPRVARHPHPLRLPRAVARRSSAASCSRATTTPTSCPCSACPSPRRERRSTRPVDVDRRRRRARARRGPRAARRSHRRARSPSTRRATADVVARAGGVIAGTRCATEVFAQLDDAVRARLARRRRRHRRPRHQARSGERPAAQRAHGRAHRAQLPVPPLRRRHVDPPVRRGRGRRASGCGTPARRCPGSAALEKAAVRAGGGVNHRGSLSDFVLVKDNHLAGMTITDAVHRALAQWPGRAVEVECDRIEQVEEAIAAGATMVLLDNMTVDDVRGVRRARARRRAAWLPRGGVGWHHAREHPARTPRPAPISSRPA